MKGKTHDLNHDLTFSAHTINCVCHSIRLMFRVLGIYNFGLPVNFCIEERQQTKWNHPQNDESAPTVVK